MVSTLREIFVSVILVVCFLSISCGSDSDSEWTFGPSQPPDSEVQNTDFAARENFSFEINLAGQTSLLLTAVNSAVIIIGTPVGNSVKIIGEKRVESDSTADAEQHLKQLEVEVQELTKEISVKTVQPEQSGGRNYLVDYTITLPMNLAVSVNQVNGSIEVSLVSSDITANLVNGTIEVHLSQDASAQLSAQTANGTITTSNLQLEDEKSSANSLEGKIGDGQNSIDLDLVNGNITVSVI